MILCIPLITQLNKVRNNSEWCQRGHGKPWLEIPVLTGRKNMPVFFHGKKAPWRWSTHWSISLLKPIARKNEIWTNKAFSLLSLESMLREGVCVSSGPIFTYARITNLRSGFLDHQSLIAISSICFRSAIPLVSSISMRTKERDSGRYPTTISPETGFEIDLRGHWRGSVVVVSMP